MLLEPQGGHTVRNMRVNIAGIITIILVIALSSAALAWYYAPPRTETLSTRFYQLQQQNQGLQDQAASLQGEFALAKEQIDGLKKELLSGQQKNETLRQRLNIYESILEARKSGGVRILRATARIKEGNILNYNLVLVKGGNYPRSVRGSVRIHAIGGKGQKALLKLGKKTAELPYKMDTHVFLEGNTPWQHTWQPEKLQITRLNYQGAERDQMGITLEHDATAQDASTRDESTRNEPMQAAAPATKEGE